MNLNWTMWLAAQVAFIVFQPLVWAEIPRRFIIIELLLDKNMLSAIAPTPIIFHGMNLNYLLEQETRAEEKSANPNEKVVSRIAWVSTIGFG